MITNKFYQRATVNPETRPGVLARRVFQSLQQNPEWDGLVCIFAFGGCTAQGDAYLRVELVNTHRDVTSVILRPISAGPNEPSPTIRYIRAEKVKFQLMQATIHIMGGFLKPLKPQKPEENPQIEQIDRYEYDCDDPALLVPDFHSGQWEVACERENGEQSNFVPVILVDLANCPTGDAQ